MEKRSLMRCFSYQHKQQFYFLGSARTIRDKRELPLQAWKRLIEKMREESLFEFLIVELSQEPNEAEIWFADIADAILCVRGGTVYESLKWEEASKRLLNEHPMFMDKCIQICFEEAGKAIETPAMKDTKEFFFLPKMRNYYQRTSIGIELDPQGQACAQVQPLVDRLLERMMP